MSAAARAPLPLVFPRGQQVTYCDGAAGFARVCDEPTDPVEAAPPLLLVHGWTATADINYATAFGQLSRRYRFVAPDLHGHGRGPRRQERFQLLRCASDLVEVLDAFGYEKVIVVGYSMGGPIAQLMWRYHGERVAGLVLCATAPTFREGFGERVRFAAVAATALGARVAPRALVRGIGHRVLRRYARDGMSEWLAGEMRRHEPIRLLQAGDALGNFDSRRWMSSIDVPTACVVPSGDDVVPTERQRQLAQAIASAEVFPLPGGHAVCLHRPQLWADTLMAALRSVVGRVRAPAH